MYAIVLIEGELANPYATLHVFDDTRLWDWLNQPVNFGRDTSTQVALPEGYLINGDRFVPVSTGSMQNDKAQHLTDEALSSRVLVTVDETTIPEDLEDEEWHDEWDRRWHTQMRALCAERKVTDTYWGQWY